jgi:hypothetical protein
LYRLAEPKAGSLGYLAQAFYFFAHVRAFSGHGGEGTLQAFELAESGNSGAGQGSEGQGDALGEVGADGFKAPLKSANIPFQPVQRLLKGLYL